MENFQKQSHIKDEIAIGLVFALLGEVLDELLQDDVGDYFLFAEVLHEDEAKHEVKVQAVRVKQLEVGLVEELLNHGAVGACLLLRLYFGSPEHYRIDQWRFILE